jgi:hypothetical protein
VRLRRGFDSPITAWSPTTHSPRAYPGQNATRSNTPRPGSTYPRNPDPASSSHNFPPCSRGECGMLSPSATASPVRTSSTHPPRRR